MMKNISFAWSLFLGYLEFNMKRTKLFHKPLITGVEITNNCNYACDFCPINSKNKKTILRSVKRRRTIMSTSDFEKIIAKYKDYMGVLDISHHGESLTHPKFSDFIRILKKYGIRYRITTNGSLLHKHIDIIADYPPTQLYFSLYTLNRENYRKLTGNGVLDITMKNIKAFLKIKKIHGLKTEVVLRTINYPLIKDDIKRFERFFSRYDVKIDKSVLNSWAGRVDINKYDKEYERHTRKDKYCIQPWQHMIICSDGGAYICNNHEDTPLGYVLKKDVLTIWNSKTMQIIRKNILSGNLSKNKICERCDYYNFSSTVTKPSLLFLFKKDFIKKFLIHIGWSNRGDLGDVNLSEKNC